MTGDTVWIATMDGGSVYQRFREYHEERTALGMALELAELLERVGQSGEYADDGRCGLSCYCCTADWLRRSAVEELYGG